MTTYVEPVILVVDNDESQVIIIKNMLEHAGYRVTSATSGPAALEVARSLEEPLELLVTDVVMPNMSGLALAAELRKKNDQVRVLYLTGFPDELFGDNPLLGPLDSFLEKPVTSDGLLEAVRMLLRRSSTSLPGLESPLAAPATPDPAPSKGPEKGAQEKRRK